MQLIPNSFPRPCFTITHVDVSLFGAVKDVEPYKHTQTQQGKWSAALYEAPHLIC